MENEGRKRRLAAGIVFLAASIMMLVIANSMLHYAPTASGGTLLDAFGAVLPYGLFLAMLIFSFLRSGFRSMKLPVRPLYHRYFRIDRKLTAAMILAFLAPFLLLVVLPIVRSLLALPSIPSPPVPTTTSGSIEVSPPVFDLWLFLSIISVVWALLALFAAVYLGKRHPSIEKKESVEETEAETTWSTKNRFVDDDYRRAILSYYAQGREHMANQGIPLTEATTPREFEKNVLDSARMAGKDFIPLTYLFEEARFSVHPMGQPEKDRAEKHYERVKRVTRTGRW
jgi:hypothetical protein